MKIESLIEWFRHLHVKVVTWVGVRPFAITLIAGVLIMWMWTLLRFLSKPSIFDLVGQQVLAHQWLNGGIDGAVVGQTNYILKLFTLYVPFDAYTTNPLLSLVVMTLVINAVTFVAMAFILRGILRRLEVAVDSLFYGAMLWMSSLAGSIFWIQFSNSRNIEVVGGLLLVYIGIGLLKRFSLRSSFWYVILAGVVFFCDPLQVYMTALPLITYGVVNALIRRKDIRLAVYLAVSIIIGYVLSLVMTAEITSVLKITYDPTSPIMQSMKVILSDPVAAMKGLLISNVQFFDGASDAGKIRPIINIICMSGVIIVWIVAICKRWIRWQVTLFTSIFFIIIEAVYLASGQSLKAGTMRYIIMLAPTIVILIASLTAVERHRRYVRYLLFLTVGINVIFLGSALVHAGKQPFNADAHLRSVGRYLQGHRDSYAYAGTDTAMTYSYFYKTQAPLLPVACDGSLRRSNLFFSWKTFNKVESQPVEEVRIVMDGSSITTNLHDHCNVDKIKTQFGLPNNVDVTDDGSQVLVYASDTIKRHIR